MQHNIHVDEKYVCGHVIKSLFAHGVYGSYTGLPTDWSKPAEAQRINSLLDMSPEADAAISVPWNFKVWDCSIACK